MAIPPMTTKSTPAEVSLRRISRASSSRHSAGTRSLGSIRPEELAAELRGEPIHGLKAAEPLVRRLPEALGNQRLIESELLIEIEPQSASSRGHHALECREPRVRPGGLQARDLGLLHPRALRELGLGQASGLACALDQGGRLHGLCVIA